MTMPCRAAWSPAEPLLAAGVKNCSIATNNVLNPFTPYGDGSLVRMANLYANVCHVSRPRSWKPASAW